MSSELVCNFCGKQFSSETLLNDHNRDVHTTVESPCNLCDKSFRSKKKLRYHMTSTHAEKEAFQCDIKSDGIQCIYYSTTNSNLRAHKKRVHDEKPTNANLLFFFIFYLVNLERRGLPPVWIWNRHPHPLIYVWGIKIQSLTHRSEDEDVCFYWDACCQDHLVSFWK